MPCWRKDKCNLAAPEDTAALARMRNSGVLLLLEALFHEQFQFGQGL
jgi:hypothetical protein